MMSPHTSSELERMARCGRSVCTTTRGVRGSVTSTPVKFFGALSCASHSTRRPPPASCSDMPSPMPPWPFSVCCERSFMLCCMAANIADTQRRNRHGTEESRARHRRRHGYRKSSGACAARGWLSRRAGRTAPGDAGEDCRRIRRAGARALVLPADITKAENVHGVFAKVKDHWGRLDVLFNNAGMGAPAVPMEELPVETWKAVVDINLNAMFYCTQEAIRIMKAQDPKGGRIINNGSISAHAPRPMSVAYTSTKHAVTGLTKTISLDGRKDDITASQIDIGNASTDLAARMANGVPQADGSIKPEPLMDVKHVGDAVLHMANLPLDVNVQFMTIMATKMPFVGRG